MLKKDHIACHRLRKSRPRPRRCASRLRPKAKSKIILQTVTSLHLISTMIHRIWKQLQIYFTIINALRPSVMNFHVQ